MSRETTNIDIKTEAESELEKIIILILMKEPFYGHLLGRIIRKIDRNIPTAGVAVTPVGAQLFVNPTFFLNDLNTHERAAVIKHEVLHLVFRHPYRIFKSGYNQYIYNISADLVVNQFVSPFPLPKSAVTLNTFKTLNLRPNQTLEYYYNSLIELRDSRRNKSPNNHNLSEDNKLIDDNLKDKYFDAHENWLSDTEKSFSIINDQNNKDYTDYSEFSETLRQTLEDQIEKAIVDSREKTPHNLWGNMPGIIQQEITAVEKKRQPTVDWKHVLRLFTSGSYRTKLIETRRKPSKRFGTYPGLRTKRLQRICVVVDTSGSISNDEFVNFFNEIQYIWKTGATILVIECDAKVQNSYLYNGKMPVLRSGGGGTDFDPAFKWLIDNNHHTYDACIYLTDGLGPKPKFRPPCPLLWLITKNGADISDFGNGRIIKMGD